MSAVSDLRDPSFLFVLLVLAVMLGLGFAAYQYLGYFVRYGGICPTFLLWIAKPVAIRL
jgi:RsiW-degrading membrane proteinase PrsW (M82 family)